MLRNAGCNLQRRIVERIGKRSPLRIQRHRVIRLGQQVLHLFAIGIHHFTVCAGSPAKELIGAFRERIFRQGLGGKYYLYMVGYTSPHHITEL